MIQPPAPVARPARTRLVATVVAALALAVPAVGLLAVLGRPATPASSGHPATAGPAVANRSNPHPSPSAPEPSAASRSVVVVPTAPGPMAVAVGQGHVWVASVGDATLRRIDPDGTVDVAVALASRETRGGAPGDAGPVIGLGAGLVWIGGIGRGRDLVTLDAVRPGRVRRLDLPAPATGIVGAFGAAWISLADGRLIHTDAAGDMTPVLGRSNGPLHVAAGDAYVWASRSGTTIAIRPNGGVARRFAGGGGPIAVLDGTAWVLGTGGPARDLAGIDERSLRTTYRSDVGTSGFADIAWALPSITPLAYDDTATAVAPRVPDSALVDGVAWIARPGEGELWRVGASRADAPPPRVP